MGWMALLLFGTVVVVLLAHQPGLAAEGDWFAGDFELLADYNSELRGVDDRLDVDEMVARLKQLRWQYTEGTTGRGRASLGMINATGCTSVWGSTYPFNPYPFPWANHLFQDTASLAMGVFEGHMAKMAEGFRAIRQAELELAGRKLAGSAQRRGGGGRGSR